MDSVDLVFQMDNDTCRVWKRAAGLVNHYLTLAKYYDEAWVMMNTTTEYEVIDDSGILNDIPY